jgi:hypothetical protein
MPLRAAMCNVPNCYVYCLSVERFCKTMYAYIQFFFGGVGG